MELSVLALTLLLVSGLQLGETAAINEKYVDEVLISFVERKCMKNADANAFAEFQDSLRKFTSNCLSDVLHGGTNKEQFSFMCNNALPKAYECLVDVVDKMEPCLDAQECYLVDFILHAYNSTFVQQCRGGAEAFESRMANLKSADENCIGVKEFIGIPDNSCIRDLIIAESHSDSGFALTQSYFCGKLEDVEECIVEGLRKICTEETFPDYVAAVLEPSLDWCTGN